MKYRYLILLLLLFPVMCQAQKMSLKKWRNQISDSLSRRDVDTILYYHRYCGACEPRHIGTVSCNTGESFTQLDNIIIYKQKGKYIALEFNCTDTYIKTELKNCRSIAYFLSIARDLNSRDIELKEMQKRKEALPTPISEGIYEEATMYCKKTKLHVFMPFYKKTEDYAANLGPYFWVGKQVELFKAIAADRKENQF